MDLLKLAAPATRCVVDLRRRRLGAEPIFVAQEAVDAANKLGIVLAAAKADSPTELDAAFAQLPRQRPDALWVADTGLYTSYRAHILAFAARERLPAVYGLRGWAEVGGLKSYGVNSTAVWHGAAS